MQTRNAIGNLINRYRAVLKKCHRLNMSRTIPAFLLGAMATASLIFPANSAFAAQTEFEDLINAILSKKPNASMPTDSVGYYDELALVAEVDPSDPASPSTPSPSEYTFSFETVDNDGHNVTLYFVALKNGVKVPNTAPVVYDSSQTYIQNFIGSSATDGGGMNITAVDGGNYNFTQNSSGRFIGNTATNNGGGVYLNIPDAYTDDPNRFDFNDLIQNTAINNGGGIYITSSSLQNLTRLFFSDVLANKATNGGGIYIDALGSPSTDDLQLINYFTVMGNIATNNGGGMYLSLKNAAQVSFFGANPISINNKATNGGGIYVDVTDGTLLINSASFNARQVFTSNNATEDGGGMYLAAGSNIGISGNNTFSGDFVNNSAGRDGGGLYATTSGYIQIGSIADTSFTGDFINNSANRNGGGMYNSVSGSGRFISNSNSFTSDFEGNRAGESGGGLYNYLDNSGSGTSVIPLLSGSFNNNTATSTTNANVKGGGLYNYDATINAFSGNYIGNSAVTNGGTAQGGAIWTNMDLNFEADNINRIISGNYTSTNNGATRDYNALFLAPNKNLNFTFLNNGSYILNDNVRTDGSGKYTVNITGDGTGGLTLNNTLYNASTVTVSDTALNIGRVRHEWQNFTGSIGDANLTLDSATLNLREGDFDLSKQTFTTDSASTLQSALGTTLTVGTASIGVDAAVTTTGAGTVNTSTNVDNLLGTVKITGFTPNLSFRIWDGSSINTIYQGLSDVAKNVYGTKANIIFDGISLDTSGLSLTEVASNGIIGLGQSSVSYGDVGSGQTATVGSILDADSSNTSAKNDGGTLTITGQSTESGQENKIAAGDVYTKNSGITNLGNANAWGISSVGSVYTHNATSNLLNISITNYLDNNGGETIAQGTTEVLGETTLNGGTFRTTNANSGNGIEEASASFLYNLPSNINGNLIAEQNSYIVLGGDSTNNGRSYAENAFIESNHDWGTGVTAALFLVEPQRLTNAGSILVNGANTGLSAAASNEASFASNSLLVVNATNVPVGTAALTSATGDGKLKVESGSKLHITGALNGSTLTIVDGFTDSASYISQNAWEGSNISSTSAFQMVKTQDFDPAIGSYIVELSTIPVGPTPGPSGVDILRSKFPDLSNELAELMLLHFAQTSPDVDSPLTYHKLYSRLFDTWYIGTNDPSLVAQSLTSIFNLHSSSAAVQNALASSRASTNTLLTRLGLASADFSENVQLVYEDNQENIGISAGSDASKSIQNGFAIWATPLYSHTYTSGFESGVFQSGYTSDLGGISLGTDYTFQNKYRVGLAINAGSGYSASNGDFNQTTNNFDFFGLSFYSAAYWDNFAIIGDMGYTRVDNDINQDLPSALGMNDVEADITNEIFTIGLTGQYSFNFKDIELTPHIALRYTHAATHSYDASIDGETIVQTERSEQDLFSIPVGITFSKDFTSPSGYLVTPKVDLGIVASFGELETKSTSSIPNGTTSASLAMDSVDGLAFRGGLGFEVKKENISIDFNYNIQASEHELSQGLFANFKYEF